MKPLIGYGSLTAGGIGIGGDIGVKKFFGVGGQGSRDLENFGFSLDDTNTRGKCMKTKKEIVKETKPDEKEPSKTVTVDKEV